MSEARATAILVRIEPSFRAIISKIERDTGVTASSYARGAILRDLHSRGLLSADMLLRVTSLSIGELALALGKKP